MIIYKFTIHGTHEDPTANAIPKLKMTGNQSWTEKARRYVAWKAYVRDAFIKKVSLDMGPEVARLMSTNIFNIGKPILFDGKKSHMKIMIHWRDKKHADSENVFGSLADALFKNDKYLTGEFDFCYSEEKKGHVDVEITMS